MLQLLVVPLFELALSRDGLQLPVLFDLDVQGGRGDVFRLQLYCVLREERTGRGVRVLRRFDVRPGMADSVLGEEEEFGSLRRSE